jgi:hypothetical protein
MTQVTVNTAPNPELLNISQLEHGVWYKVVEYIHNEAIVGEIGICVETFFSQGDIDKTLITPRGSRFSHKDLKFVEIENITITY